MICVRKNERHFMKDISIFVDVSIFHLILTFSILSSFLAYRKLLRVYLPLMNLDLVEERSRLWTRGRISQRSAMRCGREQSRLSELSIRSISPSIMLRLGDFRSAAGGLSSYAFGRLMDFPLTHESSVVICSIISGKSSATPCPHFFVLFAFGVLVSFFYFCYVKILIHS